MRRSSAPVRSKPSRHIFDGDTGRDTDDNSDATSASPSISSLDSWESLGLDQRLARHLRGSTATSKPIASSSRPSESATNTRKRSSHGLGLEMPTRVQRMAIPLILAGRDVVVRSRQDQERQWRSFFLLPHSGKYLLPDAWCAAMERSYCLIAESSPRKYTTELSARLKLPHG